MGSLKPYVVAVIADIHGNAIALRAVLDALETDAWDELVVAGDLVSRGPRDAECVDLVRGLHATAIAGNTDLNVVASNHPWAEAVRAELRPSRVDYLANLPLDYRITPPGGRKPDDDLLVGHATPTDPRAALVLEDPMYGHPGTPPAEARALIGATRANLIVSATCITHRPDSSVRSGSRPSPP